MSLAQLCSVVRPIIRPADQSTAREVTVPDPLTTWPPTTWPRLFMLDAEPSLSPGSGSSAVITPFFHRKARLTSWLASHALPTTSPPSLIALALVLPSSRAPKSLMWPFSHRKACPASVAVFDQPTTRPRLL